MAAGDVVENARQVGLFGDGLKVPVQSFLRRFVVVRDHQEQAVDPLLLGFHAELDALRGVVVAGPGHHRAPFAYRFLHFGEQPEFLFGTQRGRFASGAGDDNAVAARIKQGIGEALGLFVVHLAFDVKRL